MRNLYKTILLIFSIYILPLYAQTYKFEAGITGGVNQLYFKALPSYLHVKQAIGGSAGFQAQYNFKNNCSVVLNFSYEKKSWKPADIYYGYDNSYFQTLVIPMFFKYSVGQKRLFFVEAGAYEEIVMNKVDDHSYITYYRTAHEGG